jgi:phosphohistidine phosphatase
VTPVPAGGRPAATKHILLLRHAKSSWKDPGLADHDRPLAGRGRRAANLMARYLRQHRITPSLVLCSSALRTRQTLERIAASDGPVAKSPVAKSRVQIDPGLYLASGEDLLGRLRKVGERTASVMLIGHNPGLEDLAGRLAAGAIAQVGEGTDLGRLAAKFPTGALAVLELRGRWRDLAPGQCRLETFVTPGDLEHGGGPTLADGPPGTGPT